tara:strand:+ start:518 stop:985 length:468 start_codon:yes stop_codon:yes gene_type:complete
MARQLTTGGKVNSLQKVKKNLDYLKHKSRELGEDITNIVADGTLEEKKAYEKALLRYTDKMNEVLAKEEVKDKLDEKYKCEEKIYTIFDRVKKTYIKAVKTIMKQPLSNQEKEEKIAKLQTKIKDALVNDEDKKILNIIRKQMADLPYTNRSLLC